MSTRAQILIIEEKEDESKKLNLDKIAKIATGNIYNHSDGYPTCLGMLLAKFLRLSGARSRVNDGCYLSGWLMYYLIDKSFDMTADFSTPNYISDELFGAKRTIEDIKDFTGFGIDNCIHWDLNYVYIIDLVDKSLKVINMIYEDEYGERLGKISFENIYNKTEEELMDIMSDIETRSVE